MIHSGFFAIIIVGKFNYFHRRRIHRTPLSAVNAEFLNMITQQNLTPRAETALVNLKLRSEIILPHSLLTREEFERATRKSYRLSETKKTPKLLEMQKEMWEWAYV